MTRRLSNACLYCLAGVFIVLWGCHGGGMPPAEEGVDDSTPNAASSVEAAATSPAANQTGRARLPFVEPVIRTERPARDGDWFENVAIQRGVDFSYSDGSSSGNFAILESVGGGVALTDVDRDGLIDAVFTGGGTLPRTASAIDIVGRSAGLFLNRGNQFLEATTFARMASTSLYTHGISAADLDSDGFPDLIISGYGGLQIWMNAGDGTFDESSRQLGIESSLWNVTAVAADLNGDALQDLYLLTYAKWHPDFEEFCRNDRQLQDVCGPTLFPGEPDRLFLNTGTDFQDVTSDAGLVSGNRGLGVCVADLDDNGWLDVVIVNDVEANQCYLNSGTLPFNEDGLISGIAYSETGEREGSMGIDAGDFDNDLAIDLWYTNYAHQDNSLLRNVGHGGFGHMTGLKGLAGVSRPWVGFGTGFCDFNGDGWQDLYVVNGHVAYDRLDSPYFQPAQVFENQKGKIFAEVTGSAGPYFEHARSGRGSAHADLNHDGAPDLVICHQNEPVAILQNRLLPTAYLSLQLIGRQGDRSAVGAKVILEDKTGSRILARTAGGSYASSSDGPLLFSLTDSEPVKISIVWPGGQKESHRLAPGRYTVVEAGGSHVCP